MTRPRPSRRLFLGSTLLAWASLPFVRAARAFPQRNTSYVYPVQRTEDEWREMLSEDEYAILRGGGTEYPQSSALWNDYSEGTFTCRGCGLHVYSSNWRVEIDKGWVFFAHSEPTAVLTDIDKSAPYGGMAAQAPALIEAHCRDCSSHLGHVLIVDGQLVHCINGLALTFEAA